jgi:hypothetical protein
LFGSNGYQPQRVKDYAGIVAFMKNSDLDLIESIKLLDIKINQLKKEAVKSETTASLYNRLLIERAVLRKQFENSKKNKIVDFIRTKIRFASKKEKLICDYFK